MTTPRMTYTPQKLILIKAGSYDYAEVELSGTLQIVGPNNTGKTTLINTLQFLYIDDRRQMNFGAHTYQESCDFYFPNQYSYVLFESLGVRGPFVLGWRGQSKIVGGDPQRFHYQGPFEARDFLNEEGQVREPTDVNDQLGLKGYVVINSDAEHRDILLLPTKGEQLGFGGAGLVSLQQNAQYPQFRETLKNLLCLSTITQEQMRERLIMLASLPTGKQAYALDVRKLFGDEYERLLDLKRKLKAFKDNRPQVDTLVKSYAERERLRGEQMYLWTHMRAKLTEFQEAHNAELASFRERIDIATHGLAAAKVEVEGLHKEIKDLSEAKGSTNTQLKQIETQSELFKHFEENLARVALTNTKSAIRGFEKQLEDAAAETREVAEAKIRLYRRQIEHTNATIDHFDRALVTVLRRDLDDATLEPLIGLFNFELLRLPVGDDGICLHNREGLVAQLTTLSQHVESGIYRDPNVEMRLPASERSLAELADPEFARSQLEETKKTLKHWMDVLESITGRESIDDKLRKERTEEAKLTGLLFGWAQFQKLKAEEPALKAALNQTMHDMLIAEGKVTKHEQERDQHESAKKKAELAVKDEERRYLEVIQSYGQCSYPNFASTTNIITPMETPPDRFDPLVTYFLIRQKELARLDGVLRDAFHDVEIKLGADYNGTDEAETIRNLREELEALPEREDILQRDWGHQFHAMRAKFDEVLRALGDIKSEADKLKRSLSLVRVSNLKALHMEVIEQVDIVGSLHTLSRIDQPGLFDDGVQTEATLRTFRQKFEESPLLRYGDLFTLRFTVTGADGKQHHYQDFKQIESHGTSITIKVLFNLLVLRGLLRESPSSGRLCQVPFFLDEIHSLDAANRRAVLRMARELGFIAITAAPETVSEVDALYFLQPTKEGRIVLRRRHRMGVKTREPREATT